MEVWVFLACNSGHRNKSCEPFSFGGNVLLYAADWKKILFLSYISGYIVSWKGFRKRSKGASTLQISVIHLYITLIRVILCAKTILVTWVTAWIRHSVCLQGYVQYSGEYRSIKITVIFCVTSSWRYADGDDNVPPVSTYFFMLNWPGACQKSDHSGPFGLGNKRILTWPNINHFER